MRCDGGRTGWRLLLPAKGTAEFAFEHVASLSCYATRVATKHCINLASQGWGQLAFYKLNGCLRGFLGLLLADASLLHDDVDEFVHIRGIPVV